MRHALAGVPALDELAEHPERAAELPIATAAALLSECATVIVRYEAVREALRARVASASGRPNGDDGERLLGAEEVAHMLGRSRSWVDHHTASLPPRRSLLGQPVWLKRDVEKWIKSLPGYGTNGDA